MKQLKCTVFIFFLFSFLTESLCLLTKHQDVDNFNITQKFIEENVVSITIIAFAQYVQTATFDEVEILVKDMVQYKDKCLANKTLPECSELPINVLQERICALEGVPQKHNLSYCCSKVDFERRLCFLHNKKADVEYLLPFPTLDPEEKCQAYQNNRESFLNHYMYEVARRNPFIFAPTLFIVASQFEEVAKTCCQEQQKANCFRTKEAPVTQYLKAMSSYQKTVCGALFKFGPKLVNSINIAVFSKKFPMIEFTEATSLLEDISSMYDGCCEGDVIQCIREQSKVISHICSKQDSISSKIKECCVKDIPERGACIINTNNDDRPQNLSLREESFIDSENMCQERDTDLDKSLTKFTHEYARRHSELSTPELLRITKVHEDLLEDCCNKENPADCYQHAEDKFNETTEKSLQMVQQECERFRNLGKDGLKYHYLFKFTKIAPQLSTEELISLGKEMVRILTTCCILSEEFACVDDLADLVLGEICGINENRTINPAVDNCCNANFPFRRLCFDGLKADEMYVPPEIPQDWLAFRIDWCQAQTEELPRKKDRFLVDLVKLKPELTFEQLWSLFTNVTAVLEKCCRAQDPDVCFNQEGPKLGN